METKLATIKDFEFFKEIKKEFHKDYAVFEKDDEFILEEFKDYLGNGAIILAYDKTKPLGYICGIIEEDMYEKTGHIGEVFVLKEYRGKGISSILKDKFLEFLKSKGISICRIDVNPDNPAQEAYKKWGFKIDKYRMSLSIPNAFKD
jgi:ribosomal protein S18 acetylase RimI-like enzyme